MSTEQLKLRFNDGSERVRLWASLPLADQMSIARGYARLLIKAAKVAPHPTETKGKNDDKKPKKQ